MDKVRRDKRKEVHARLDFEEGSRERRTKEDSHHSSARARTTKPERLKVRDRLRYGDRHVLDQLGHRRESAFDRLSETYSPSTTKSRPGMTNSRDHPRGRSRPRRLDTSNEDCPEDTERFRADSYSHSYHDRDCSRHMKKRRDNESPLSSVSKSDSNDRRYRKSRSKRHKPTDEDDLTRPWMCEDEDPFTPRIPLIGAAKVWFDELPPESVNSYKDLKAAFLAYFMQQKKHVKDHVEIHNIKQKDGETIEDFMKRFKVKTRHTKRGPECMRISEFMHGVNNPKLKKRLNEHVPKTMEEMMITTTAFIRGEAAADSKRKGKEGGLVGSPPLQGSQKKFLRPRRIEELVRVGKLSHLIKEIKHGRDQSKAGKKEIPAKDKPAAIYMIQSWQRMTRQKVTQSFERVREITFLPLTTSSGVEGPLVIEAEMGGHMIHRMYVDRGSSMKLLYEHRFNRLRHEVKNQMIPATTSLTSFSGETIWPLGQLRFLLTIGDADHSTRAWMNFMIVRSLSPYNDIIGRREIREIQAVPSTTHEMLKFTIEGGIVTICSIILIPAECTPVITSSAVPKEVGARVSRSVAEHRLNIREGYSPVRQKKRSQAPKRAKAIQAEVQKLVEAGIMREVYYQDWLSNPVMVKKHDGSWRMCVDFTDLNKRLVDKAFDNQIGRNIEVYVDELVVKSHTEAEMLREPDEEKTAFHTGQGVCCHTKIPFGLKNVGATYQRLVDKAFDNQIGRNIEVYVDDLVVKSHTEAEMLRGIDETFCTLRKINMKLNPKKCTFGAAEGVFLGYVVTPEWIKPCLDKTAIVLQLPVVTPFQKSTEKLNLSAATLSSVSWTLTKATTRYSSEPDEEKTAFHTGQGVCCHTKIPFGLKNVGATYQRLVDKAFDNQIGRNIEVYVDDLVVKSHTEAEMLR
nr:reverse transcriptase domain-containing protein [Tanacetum cinerariifolium]